MTMACRSLPVIDISGIMTSGGAEREKRAAAELHAAAQDFGFFHIIGHGIDGRLITSAMQANRAFFDMPLQGKEAVRAVGGGEGTGWEPSGSQKLDEGRLGEGVDGAAYRDTGDVKESYILGRPATAQLPPGVMPGTLAALWPESLGASFQDPMLAYHDQCWRVCKGLMRGWAIALEKPPDFFDADLDDPMTKLRLLYYPPEEDRRYERATGLAAHTDWGALTLLAQDEVGGLEVCTADGEWLPGNRVSDDSLLVNVGDMMQRWTNGRYRSAPHRLVKPTTSSRARSSIAFFFNMNADATIDPCRLLAPGEEPRYAPIQAEAYILERASATY